ncbi:hypothetical protein JHK85_000447 [Glycine max]|nr:hypothetical protein JHK85_000447 [Glycine max]
MKTITSTFEEAQFVGNSSNASKLIFTSFEYKGINYRAHSASLTDFCGVGARNTSNTKAFQSAISHLSQFASKGRVQLYVPAGKWLTGSFSLISHFTLYVNKDAFLVASQVFAFHLSFSAHSDMLEASILWLAMLMLLLNTFPKATNSGRYFGGNNNDVVSHLPFDVGFEVVGIIATVGDSVTDLKVVPRLDPEVVAMLTSGLTASIALEKDRWNLEKWSLLLLRHEELGNLLFRLSFQNVPDIIDY